MYQFISVPANASLTLSYYTYITSDDAGRGQRDYLYVNITDWSFNLLATIKTHTNLTTSSGYVLNSFSLGNAYAGQNIGIYFEATTDSILPTVFRIDDVKVLATISTPTVPTPSISPNGGTYTGSVQVTLSCSDSQATIRYTTNGNDPTSTSSAYGSPFTLTSSTTVKAKAFRSGYSDSGIASASFTINTTSTGACCLSNGNCSVTTEANCAGSWSQGGSCSPNPCGGALTVVITPPEATAAGARWRRSGASVWYTSGATESGIEPGAQVVEFKTTPGWLTPSNKNVTITAGDTATTSGAYTQIQQTGALLTGLVIGLNGQGQSQGPLVGATISAPGIGSTTSGSEGEFTFAAVQGGTFSVTVSKSGYHSVTRSVTLQVGITKYETFQLTAQSTSGTPLTFGFSSPNGKHFVEGMPGNLSFSTDVVWNGSPGTVRFNMAGTWYPATITDLGGGMARATLTVAAPTVVAACTELTMEVTNGAGNKTNVNTEILFSPIPWITGPWYRDNIPWTRSGLALTYSESVDVYPLGFLPDGIHLGPLTIEPFGGGKKNLRYDLLAGHFSGDFTRSLGAKFKTEYVPVFGQLVRGLGEARGNWSGGLDISLAGCDAPRLRPSWRLGVSGKAGVGVPVVLFVEPIIPPAAPAINLLLGIPVVSDVVGALEMRFYVVLGVDWTGKYPNGELGDNALLLHAKTVEGTATIGAEAQCVLELHKASVGVYVGGTATLPIELPLQITKVRGYAGVFAGYLLFQYKREYGVELTFDDASRQGARITAISPVRESGSWEPIGKGLSQWGTVNRLAADEAMTLSTAQSAVESGGSEEEAIVENVTGLSSPTVVADGSETFINYSALDEAKPWYAATDIGTLWQVGADPWNLGKIADDNDAEFSPQIIRLDATTNLAAWERVSGDVAGATGPEDVAPHLEIVTARFDRNGGTWNTPIQLTTNSVVDREPVPVVFGSKQGIMWIQNQAGDSPGNVTNGDSLLFAEWNGTAYQSPQMLWSGQKGILSLSFAADAAGQGFVAFAVDEDGDTETKTDRELYAVATASGAWQTATRMTNDTTEDAVPVLIAVNGTPICVWSAGGIVSYTPLDTWNPKVVYAEYTTANEALSLDGVVLPGGAAVAYTVQGPEGVDIVASFYDAVLDKWSLPRQLTQDEHAESALSLACDGMQLVIAYLKTQTARNSIDIEINGVMTHLDNVPQPARTDLYILRHALGYDLAVTSESITVEPPNPPPGSAVSVKITLENRGDLAVQNAEVAFYDGDPNNGGAIIGTVQVIPDMLVGGASREVTVPWSIPPSGSNGRLYVIADPSLTLDDRDRSNNTASLMTVLPDLTIETAWYSDVSDTSVALTARVANTGSISSDGTEVSWRLGAADGPEIGRTPISPLAAGGAYEAAHIWDVSTFCPGEYVQVVVVVDTSNAINEWNENNNVSVQSVRVPTRDTLPTITVIIPEGGEIWQAGATLTVTWTTCNATGDANIWLYRNGDAYLYIGSVNVSTGTFDWNICPTIGDGSDYSISVQQWSEPHSAWIADWSDSLTITGSAAGPTLTVTGPNDGEVLQAGSIQTITWTASNVTGDMYIDLYKGDQPLVFVGLTPVSAGSFEWTICPMAGDGTDYSLRAVVVSEPNCPWIEGWSDGNFAITGSSPRPTLTLTSPNGGETWQDGTMQTVTWASTSPTGNVYIYLNKAGQFYSFIGSAPMSAGSFTANICASIGDGSDYRMQIQWQDCGPAVQDTSDADFTITGSSPRPTLTLASPNGGESWQASNTQTITWTSINPSGDVSLYLYKDGQFHSFIGSAPMFADSFTWNICEFVGDGSDYIVWASWCGCGPCIEESSDASFTITGSAPSPILTLTSPNGGEILQAGTSQTITWTTTNPSGDVYLYLYKGGQPYLYIGSSPMSAGSFSWNICSFIGDGADYSISIYTINPSCAWVVDFTDASFAISNSAPSPLTLTSPNGGETLQAGTSHDITWNSTIPDGYVNIQIYKVGQESVTIGIGTVPATAGSFTWNICEAIGDGTDYKVRIASSDNCGEDFSDSTFTIIGSTPLPTLTLTSPNGGEVWQAGTTQAINWNSTNATGIVNIRLLKNGELFRHIGSAETSTGFFDWSICSGLGNSASYKVQIEWQECGLIVQDTGDGNFGVTGSGPPTTLILTSPNGGETWQADTTHNITWNSTNPSGGVHVYLYKGGQFVTFVGTAPMAAGIIEWNICGTIAEGADYTLYLYSPDSACGLSLEDYSDASFTINGSAEVTTLTSPNGGENWQAGSTHAITWNSTNPVGDLSIFLYKNNQQYTFIGSAPMSDGSFDWNVCEFIGDGSDYTVHLSWYDYCGHAEDSDASFSINGSLPLPTLALTSPTGGETWQGGTTQTITWESTNPAGDIVVYMGKGENEGYQSISGLIPISTGYFEWNLPAGLVPSSDYWIGVLWVGCGEQIFSISDDFTITAGALPPLITAWRSVRTHSSAGELAIVLNASASGNGSSGPTVETRGPNSAPGVRKVEVDFDGPIALVGGGAVSVMGRSTVGGALQGPVDYSAACAVSLLDSDTLQLVFAAGALPDETCYTIDIAGVVEGTTGSALGGDTDCSIRALIGDANGSGTINITDQLAVKSKVSAPVQDSPQFDLNVSGNITVTDQLLVKSRVTSPSKSALCP